MDYLLYEPEDFASDESYLRYYFRVDEADTEFWQNWVSNNPEKLDIITNADHLIGFLALHLEEAEYMQEYDRLMQVIASTGKSARYLDAQPVARGEIKIVSARRRSFRWLAAASVIGVIAIAGWIWTKTSLPASNQELGNNLHFTSIKTVSKTNSTQNVIRCELEDGSVVTLQPASTLTYPEHFNNSRREVYLDGEAFFEVSKNVKRPFYVYHKNLVTHVLGTSFKVKVNKEKSEIEVAVRTGKVEVYELVEEKTTGSVSSRKTKGVILTPNQKMVYSEQNKQFESSLVDVPMPIQDESQGPAADTGIDLEKTIQKSTPIADILQSIEHNYGIEIEVENENVHKCHFSGDVSEMNLYMKLEIICQSIGATYKIKGTKLLIRGTGCN